MRAIENTGHTSTWTDTDWLKLDSDSNDVTMTTACPLIPAVVTCPREDKTIKFGSVASGASSW